MVGKHLMTLALAAGLILGQGFSLSVGAKAAVTETSMRVNLSGRQRMLSQRMAKASCFAMTGVNVEKHRAEAMQAAAEFETVLKALQLGDPNLGFQEETHDGTLQHLRDVYKMWSSYGASVRQLANGDVLSVVVTQMVTQNVPVLVSMNKAVGEIVQNNSIPVANKNMAKTIDFAGRQRMLSQKMAKEFCFLVTNIDVENMREDLQKTIELFDLTLGQLEGGDYDAGIMDPPNLAVLITLEEVRAEWLQYKPLFMKAIDGQTMEGAEIETVALLSNAVLAASHKVVLEYVNN